MNQLSFSGSYTRVVCACVAGFTLAALLPSIGHAAPAAFAASEGVLSQMEQWVASLTPFVRLAAVAGLGGYAIAYFLVPWFPCWSQQHRDWVRGAGFVLLLMLFGPDLIKAVVDQIKL